MHARAVDARLAPHVGDIQISSPRTGNHRRHFDNHAPAHVLDAGRISELQMMGSAVHAIDHQIDTLAHLIAGQSLAEDTADNRFRELTAVGDILADPAFLVEATIDQRLVHGFDDVALLAKLFQGRLGIAGDNPASRLRLGGETVVFQMLCPADHKVPVLADEVGASFSRPQIDDALISLLGNQHFVQPSQALSVHLVRELAGDFDLTLMSQFQRHQFARPVADAMGDIVARDVEDFAVIGDAPDDDMGMGMAGVVVIHGDPIEAGVQVLLHLPHEVAGEAAQIIHLAGVFRRDDESELVPVLPAPLDEGAAVRIVFQRRIGAALFAVAGDAIAFEIAQMGIRRLARRAAHLRAARSALRVEFDYPRLDDDPPRAKPAGGVSLPAATILWEGCHHLRAPASGVEPAASFPFSATRRCRSPADPIGVAASLANGDLDLPDKGRRARVDARSAASGPPRLDVEIVSVIACHKGRIGSRFSIRKMSRTPIVVKRKNTCCNVETAECTSRGCHSLSFVIKWIADGAALAATFRVPR